MIVVTGGAGFIGSRLIAGLNARGHRDILVVDDLTDGQKFRHLVSLDIADYFDKTDFLQQIKDNKLPTLKAIFHQGACSTTTEWDGKMMMENNYEYSKKLLSFAEAHHIPFLYASSAAIYGGSEKFKESPQYEKPLNVYGFSKLLFDQWVRRKLPKAKSPIVGFRYFNVYGPNESHKGSMASVAYHLHQQLCSGHDRVKLFEGCAGYGDGEQRRDFVYVDDVVDVNCWAWENGCSGIFNVGTGRSQTFNEVAQAVIEWHGRGQIEYIPFPAHLKDAYQSYTEADISALQLAGYNKPFRDVLQGVRDYLDHIRE